MDDSDGLENGGAGEDNGGVFACVLSSNPNKQC